MKASLTLPERPSALYLLAVLDVLVLLLIFFTLLPVVAQQSGMRVEPVEMSSRISSLDPGKSVGLTIKPGSPPLYFLETRRIAFEDLPDALGKVHEEAGVRTVIVSADKRVHWSVVAKVTLVIDKAGLNANWLGVLPRGEARDAGAGPPKASPNEAGDDAPQS